MAKSNYPFKINGYIYSPKTKEGFLRMKRQGIPRPLFSIQDKLAKALNSRYRIMIRKLLKELRAKLKANDIVLDSAPEDDSLESLMKFFEEMGNEIKKENQKIADKANLQAIADSLEKEWFDEDQEEIDRLDNVYSGDVDELYRPIIEKTFKAEQSDYLQKLFKDASSELQNVIVSFSVDKKKFFNDNMEAVRKLYVDNSLARIQGEENLIKRKMLQRIIDYATNKTDKLKLNDLTKECFDTGDHLSRLFARDQMQRFNKACTLSTFHSAGVTKVKWVTANDGRVRKIGYVDKAGVYHRPHTELQGKIFDVNNLPIEIDDYNCRCGLVPVEWRDD